MYAYCQVNQYSCVLQVTGLFVLPGTDVCVLPCIHICEPSGTARYTCMYVCVLQGTGSYFCQAQDYMYLRVLPGIVYRLIGMKLELCVL